MKPILYIIVRNDLDSLNPGKAAAQAAHAANAFAALAKTMTVPGFDEWENQTNQNFGTTIVLAGNQEEIDAIIAQKGPNSPIVMSEWIFDPTYPIKDGKVTHLIPLRTCAYAFVPDVSDLALRGYRISQLPLHP